MSGLASPARKMSRSALDFLLRSFVHWTLTALFLFWMLPLAWASGPTFTVANTTFASIPLGQSETQSVTVTVNAAVAIKTIALQSGFTEYNMGTVTGCKTDGVTINAVGTVCAVQVTFTPKATGSTASPATARTAPLLVTDVESRNSVTYAFGLLGAATGPIMQFTPATLTRVAGAAVTGYPAGDQGLGIVNSGYAGDNGPATAAKFSFLNIFSVFDEPAQSMVVDSAGNIYVIDLSNQIIRRIDGTSNVVTTVVGTPKTYSRTGDGGLATSATIEEPASLALDAADNIYFSDAGTASNEGSFNIRVVNAGTGIISSIAGQNLTLPYSGTGTCVESGQSYTWEPTCGDGGLAADAFIYNPQAIAIDGAGNIYILEEQGTIRRIDAVTGIITTVGNAVPSGVGEGLGMAIGADGNLYASVYDSNNPGDYLTQIDPTTGKTKIVGGGAAAANNTTCTEQGTPATDWFLGFTSSYTNGISADGAGNIYGATGLCGVLGQGEVSFRYNIASGLAYAFTSGVGGGSGGNNGTYTSFGGSYGIQPSLSVADSAGNIYFQTYNQIALLSGSQGVLGGYQSRVDYQTDAAGTICGQYAGDFCERAVIANVGNAPLDTSFTLSSGFTFLTNGDGSACAAGTLNPGDFCNLDVEFTPVTAGTVNGTVTLTDNALLQSDGVQSLSLVGTGVAAPLIAFSPATITFGNQLINTTSAAQAVTISSPGTGPNTLEGIYLQASGSSFGVFTIAGGTCPMSSGSLASGASCTVLIAFAPTAPGSYSATLMVNNNVGSGTLSATSVSGTGVTSIAGTAVPVISPAAGAYNAPVAVQITDATANAVIYDTRDGTAPTTSSMVYTAPFTVSVSSTKVQAIAAASGDTTSAVATSTYTVEPYLSFNAAAVGVAKSSAQSLTATFSLLSTTTPMASLHYGKDYSVGTLSCTPNGAIEVCTVPVSFAPTLPGARKDALLLKNGSTILATVLLGGIGQAPLSLVQPGVVTNPILNGPNYIYGSTADENDTVYLLEGEANSVVSVTKAGLLTKLPITGLQGPSSIAVDGAGMLYIAQNTYSKTLVTYNTLTGVQGTISIVPPAPYTPCANSNGGSLEYLLSVAVDDVGNLFALETLCGNVIELKTDGSFVVTPIDPTMIQPSTITVDSLGSVFVGGYDINEIPATGTQTQVNAVGAGDGIQVDAAETIYATRYTGANGVAELAASDYATSFASLDSGAPLGESLASDGTLFVGNYNNLDTVDRSQGAIDFGEQQSGVASSPQTVSIYNGGNESLTIASFALSGGGFTISTVGTGSCTEGIVLAPGSECGVAVTLTPPHAGLYSGTLTFTSNSLNTASTTQTVALSGFAYGTYVTETPNPLNFGTITAGTTSAPLLVTFTNNGDLYSAGVGSPSSSNSAFTVDQDTCAGVSLNVGSTCQMSVTFSPTAAQAYTGTVSVGYSSSGGGPNNTVSFTVNGTGAAPAAPLATLTPSPLVFSNEPVNATSLPNALTLSNTGNAPLAIGSISIGGANSSAFSVSTGTNSCGTSLAAGATCNIYVTFTPSSAATFTATLWVADNASGSPQTATLTGTGVGFVSNVGTALAAQAVTVKIGTAGTVNSIQVLTQGAVGLDFASAPGGTCAVGTAYAAAESCSVDVIFKPGFAGRRTGAILLTDSSGNVLGTTYLPGTGIGPQIVFGPGTVSTLPAPTSGDGYQAPLGIAADAGGNIFVSDTLNDRVVKLPKSGTGYGTPILVPTTGLNNAGGIAVDGSGNVFIADTGNSRVVEVPWTGSAYGTQATLPAPVSEPEGVAVDGNGNVFIADTENKRLVELPWTGTGYGGAITTLASGLEFPKGVAVDANENVYIADTDNDQIVELPWNGTAYGPQITLPTSNLNQPFSLAIGAGGNLYIADSDDRLVVELPWNGTAFGAQVDVPIYALGNASGVTVDGGGNVYVADGGNNDAVKLDVADAPALSFASTNVGSTSTDSPKTVLVTNIGNASLTFASGSNPSFPANFPVNSKDASLCVSSTPLMEGASCDVSVNFTPTSAGSLTGNVVLTDNDLNGTGASQSIAVSGTGLAVQVAATPVISPGTGTYTTNQTVSISDSTVGATIYYSTDGSTPTTNSIKYTAPFVVSRTGTNVQAIAFATGYTNSAVALAVYTLNAVTPVLAPPGGTYAGPQSVAITSTTPGAAIYYSTNGIAPTTESTLYTQPISVTQSGTTIQAIATLSGYNNSPVASGTYTIQTPAVTLAPTALQFGNVYSGTTSAAQTVKLTNSGTGPLTVSPIVETGTNPVQHFFETDNCVSASPLAAGASCTITVTFAPTVTGSQTAKLSVTDNAAGSPQTVALSGTGVAPVVTASLTPAALNFLTATGTTSAAQTATLKNTSTTAMQISAISIAGEGAGDFSQTNTCGSSLGPGATCTISVSFTPASAAGFTATLTVADNATGSPQTVALSGTGTVPLAPVASLTPSSLTFTSNTGVATAAQTATLKNTGNAALAISGISLTGANPGDFSETNTCITPLAAGASCAIAVVFTPASAASFTATLTVADNAAGSPQTTIVSGTGTTPPPPNGDFSVSASPGTQTVTAGAAAKFAISVATTPSGDVFSNVVTLTATGLPAGGTATFSPGSVTPGTGSATSTLTVQTAASTSADGSRPRTGGPPWRVFTPSFAFVFGGFGLLLWRRRHGRLLRGLSSMVILAALGIGAWAMTGCGGGFAFPTKTAPPQTYTITVTGTSGENTHSITVTLTVQQPAAQ